MDSRIDWTDRYVASANSICINTANFSGTDGLEQSSSNRGSRKGHYPATYGEEDIQHSTECQFPEEVVNRGRLESDILHIAGDDGVQKALQEHVASLSSSCGGGGEGLIATGLAASDAAWVKSELHRGLKAIMSASCDKRLEVFHWMTMRLWAEGMAMEIVEWFFVEAAAQLNETEREDKAVIEEVFGRSGSEAFGG